MQKDNEFKIKLRVAEKEYRISCKRSEEELYRKAATAINKRISQYSSHFSGAKLEMKDLLIMAALHVSVENLLFKKEEDTSLLFEKIELLDKELEEYLKSVQTVQSINLN